ALDRGSQRGAVVVGERERPERRAAGGTAAREDRVAQERRRAVVTDERIGEVTVTGGLRDQGVGERVDLRSVLAELEVGKRVERGVARGGTSQRLEERWDGSVGHRG